MLSKKHTVILAAFAVALAAAFAMPVFAADADWVAPLNEGTDTLRENLTDIAGGVIGLSIIAYALWGAIKHRLEMSTFAILFVCGLLVGIGPRAITWWIDIMQG